MPKQTKSKRKRKLEGEIGAFIRQYARKAEAGIDPNDRGYSREIEKLIKRMKPEELDELMHGSEEDFSEDSSPSNNEEKKREK